MASEKIGLLLLAASDPGVLHELSGVIARHQGDIPSVEIVEQRSDGARIYFETGSQSTPFRRSTVSAS